MKLSKMDYLLFILLIINLVLSIMFFTVKGKLLGVNLFISIIIIGVFAICILVHIRNTRADLELEKSLNRSILQYESLFKYNLDIIFSLDSRGFFTSMNPIGEQITGFSKEEMVHSRFDFWLVNKDVPMAQVHIQKCLQGTPEKFETKILSKENKVIELLISTVPIMDGEIFGLIGIAKDITGRKEMERKLSESEQRYRSLFQYNPDAILSLDLTGNFVRLNPICTVLSGYSNQELSKMNFSEIITKEDLEKTQLHFQKATEGEPQTYESSIYHKDGHVVFLKATNIPIRVDHEIVGVYGIVKDITKHKLAEDQIEFMAFHDPLTSLPNRRLFKNRLNQALELAKKEKFTVGIFFLDLDQFKLINDTLGHNTGDLLLIEVTKRLKNCIREQDTLSRQGGDEFTILLPKVTQLDAQNIAEKIIFSLRRPFKVDQNELFITPSIGISFYPFHSKQADELLLKADIAMYKAKELGKNNYHFYNPMLEKESRDKLMIQNELYKALELEQFILYYQPKIDIDTNQLVGVEALIRWQHPNGMIPPMQFISILEETGLIIPIGEWILREACQQNKRWQDEGYPPISISVNLSTRQFYQQHLISMVSEILQETGLSAEYLEVEITESMTMDVDLASSILHELKALGVKISIDDFGTGYSSLYYLKKFPIDGLKIDQSFIRDILTDQNDSSIVTTIIDMAHHLGLKVIAEGVETAEQLHFLKENQCDEAQGYLFSPPVPAKGSCQHPKNIETFFERLF